MRRIVVTGLGLVTPLGMGVERNWERACRGETGIGRISRFDPSDLPCQIAGEVEGFDPADYMDKKEIKKMDFFIHYALAAASMAMEDSGLKVPDEEAERMGVLVGVGLGGLPAMEKYHELLLEGGHRKVSPFFIPMLIANLASGQVSIRYGLKGPNSCVATACASGAHAIGDSLRLIQRGEADVMVAGGAEATITPLAIAGFASMRALSGRNEEPTRASRPFDKERDGFVMGEGAGILILEELEHALNRGARIYAELLGYGLNADAYHITMPAPEAEGAARCMRLALKDARLLPEDVDYINAHGTSTPMNDKFETLAIKQVFGPHAYKLAVSSTKSMTGHLLGAAGGIEGVFSVLSLYHQALLPTINYEVPDPECDLDYVPNVIRKADVEVVLSNSFGFGGTNAALVFGRFQGT
ncbi:MAG: beta-ketoacyl-ACP synthase II [Candidatus Tectomicrobia bacterium]|uniref:3-oxoacyl-[acyl-carrier-protein] synthase 2 n=1 Tax=Tectimicrobiota bacterium TaxID=2528274 RepID=A0A932FY63_UNCTE|nr:beta-ketoacyl-ACP synthase II [Candidatus Tectomicrobia bacterium]